MTDNERKDQSYLIDDEPLTRKRAYDLWEKAGKPEGRDLEFWLQAEKELGTSNPELMMSFTTSLDIDDNQVSPCTEESELLSLWRFMGFIAMVTYVLLILLIK